MSVPDEDIRDAVDQVLEAAWPEEHRRARRRWNLGTLARVAAALAVFCGLPLMAQLIVGFSFSWAFYGILGGVIIKAGVCESRDPNHLRHHRPHPPGI
jgi:hypothetical protein